MRRLGVSSLPALGTYPTAQPLARSVVMLAGLGLALALRLDIAGGATAWHGGTEYRPVVAGLVFALVLLAIAWAAGMAPPGSAPARPILVELSSGSAPETPATSGSRMRVSPHLRIQAGALAWGIGGAAVLIAFPLVFRLNGTFTGGTFPAADFPLWAAVVSLVAVAEEVLLRGVLFAAIMEVGGTAAAVLCTAGVFALLHVPLYGPGELPLGLAAGIWLGTLRVVSGSVAAPAAAHTLADLAAWWLA